jgi:hypothetical protein
MRERPGLLFRSALSWATAKVNQINFVTVEASHIDADDPQVIVPYR